VKFEVREATPGDLPAIRQLCQSSLAWDRQDAPELADLLWSHPEAAPSLRLLGSFGGAVLGAALGTLAGRPGPDGVRRGHLTLLVVAPEARDQGLGRLLLSSMEERMAALGAGEAWVGNQAPCYAWPGVDVRYTPACCLLESSGYQATPSPAMNMTVDLEAASLGEDEGDRALGARGISVERLSHEQPDAFLAWVEAHWGPGWAWEAARTLRRDPVSCHVARRGGEILGFACHGTNRRSWFGPTGTAPSARGQGIGTVLLRRCLADQRAAGLRTAEIAWVGPARFYSRAVGAFLDRTFRTFARPLS